MKKKFWNYTAVYGLGFLLLRGISFFLLPLYTNLLSQHDGGLIFLIYTVLAFLNPLYAYGMNASLLKFYNDESLNSKSVLSTSFVSLFVSSSLITIFFILISHNINWIILDNSSINWFLFLALILFADSISSRIFALLRLAQKPFYFLSVGFLNIVLSVSLNYYLIKVLTLGVFGALLSLLVVSFVQMVVLLPFIALRISPLSFSVSLFKKMFRFAIPFLPSALLFIVIGFSDRWFIKYFLNTESVGLYGAGYKLGSIMSLGVTAFNLNWQPYYLKFNNNNNNRFGGIGNVVIIALIVIFTLLIYFVNDISLINFNGLYLIGERFQGGLIVVPYIALGYLLYGVYVLQMPSIFILNKQNWGLCFWVLGAITNIVGNYFLIPRFGFLGAAYSSALGYFVMMVFLYVCNLFWMPIKYNFFFLMINVLAGITLLILKFYFNLSFFAALLYLVIPVFCVYLLNKKITYD